MVDLQIVLPRAPSAYEIQINWHYEKWREEKAKLEEQFVIENVRFQHHPDWRNNIWSIQAAADQRGIFMFAKPLSIVASLGILPFVAPQILLFGAILGLGVVALEKHRTRYG